MQSPGLEREYDIAAAIPGYRQVFATWAERSAQSRAHLRSLCDLAYGPSAAERLDLFLPRGEARGTLLFFHGGYWQLLDKSDFSFLAEALVEAGLAVGIVNYALAPRANLDEIVRQCRTSVVWLLRESPVLELRGKPLVVSGHSAGGHLAAMLLCTDWSSFGDLPLRPLAGGLAISGLFDLRPLLQTSVNRRLALDASAAQRLSPAFLHAPALPLRLAVGEFETGEFHRQSALLRNAWPTTPPVVILPGRNHLQAVEALAEVASGLPQAILDLFGSA